MGARFREMRNLSGLTQEQMGQALGVADNTIQGWETGRNMIDVVALARAVELTGFSTDFVILGEIGSLRFDKALEVQASRQRHQGTAPPPRGGRAKKTVPTVDQAPDNVMPVPKDRTLHEPPTLPFDFTSREKGR